MFVTQLDSQVNGPKSVLVLYASWDTFDSNLSRICSLVAARLGLLCLLRRGIVGLNQTFRNRWLRMRVVYVGLAFIESLVNILFIFCQEAVMGEGFGGNSLRVRLFFADFSELWDVENSKLVI